MLTAHLIGSLNNHTRGLGWHEYPLEGWTFEDAIALWENFKKFLEAQLSDTKYILVDKDTDSYGTSVYHAYAIAAISGGRLMQLKQAANLAWPGAGGYGEGCYYDNWHFVYPNGVKGSSGGSSPFFHADIGYVADALNAKDGIPYNVIDEMYEYYLGRPHELLPIAQKVIQCLKDAQKAYNDNLPAPPPKPTSTEPVRNLPKWLWWVGGSVVVAGLATGAVLLARKGT